MGEWYSWWKPDREKVELEALSAGDEHSDAPHPFSSCPTFWEMRLIMKTLEEKYSEYDLAFDYKTASLGYGAREIRWVLVGLKKQGIHSNSI